jgi:hypothetical protein
VGGNVTNTGFLQNNGLIGLAGNWSNTFVYQGAGEVSFTGESTQLIDNHHQQIGRVTVEGGGDKKLIGKLPITQQLKLVNGIITVGDADTLWLENTATVTGGSHKSYVHGSMITEGVGYKYYPIGNSKSFYPIELLDIKGLNPTLKMELLENVAVTNADRLQLHTEVFWHHTALSGTMEKSAVALGLNDVSNQDQLIIAHAPAIDAPFEIEEVVFYINGNYGLQTIGSTKELTGNIIGLGWMIPSEEPSASFYLSTTLSPNAIEPNNRFARVFGNDLRDSKFLFQVFDRAGLTVFESRSLQAMQASGWDGKHQSSHNSLPSGVYPYILKGLDHNGQYFSRHGLITIIN